MIRLFTGYDPRMRAGWHAFSDSVIAHASEPVAIVPLVRAALSDYVLASVTGTNDFTYSRFCVPALCDYTGWAIFMDGVDMIVRTDIAMLWAERETMRHAAVACVRHPSYETRHKRKYVGTPWEADNRDYARKNWASVMLMNCAHPAWRTPIAPGIPLLDLLQLRVIPDAWIVDLQPGWNWLVDEYGPNEHAEVLHWTAGVPGLPAYRNAAHANEWHEHKDRANGLG